MKLRNSIFFLSLLGLTLLSGCFPKDPTQLERISEERALEISLEDAEKVYENMEQYEATIDSAGTRWEINYSPKDSTLPEGPQYLVANRGGMIVMKYYPRFEKKAEEIYPDSSLQATPEDSTGDMTAE